jgi:hypothetical protein
MKSMACGLLFLFTADGWAVAAATSGTNGSIATGTDPVPHAWLYVPGRTLIFHVQHQGLTPGCRYEAAEMVHAVLCQFIQAQYTVYLSRSFVEAEAGYYRSHAADEPERTTAEQVIKCLDAALQSGQFGWARLREIHQAASKPDSVARSLPWLSLVPGIAQVRLAPAGDATWPVLNLNLSWSGRRTRGVVGRSVNSGMSRTDYSWRPDPWGFTGEGYLWKVDADIRLQRNGTNWFERGYPAPAWQDRYVGMETRPLFITTQRILQDLKAGLVPPDPPSAQDKKRKKR